MKRTSNHDDASYFDNVRTCTFDVSDTAIHLIPPIIRSVLTYRNMERDFSGGWKVIAKNR